MQQNWKWYVRVNNGVDLFFWIIVTGIAIYLFTKYGYSQWVLLIGIVLFYGGFLVFRLYVMKWQMKRFDEQANFYKREWDAARHAARYFKSETEALRKQLKK